MPRITKDEIMNRLDVQAFYEDKFQLSLRELGSEWTARCPFHDDKVSSLSIRQSDGVFHCHACQAGGSVFDFLMMSASVDPKDPKNFKRALDEIAAMVGIQAPQPTAVATINLDDMPMANIPQPGEVKRLDPEPETRPALFALPPGAPKKQSKTEAEEAADRAARPPIEESVVDSWHQALVNNPTQLHYLLAKRGITLETVSKYRLGWTGDRYAIPIRDDRGVLVNVRKYKPEATGKDMKMISYSKGSMAGDKKTHKYGEARLTPLPIPAGKILVCEGEMDCLLALQEGFDAVTPTSGCGHWNDEWSPLFSGRDVVIAFDKDEAGRKGAESVAKKLVNFASSVAILKWPDALFDKGDLTNFIVDLGGDAKSLGKLVDAAVPFVTDDAKQAAPVKKAKLVALSDSSLAENSGKKIRFRGLVSGKDTAPFIIPRTVTVRCGQENGTKCGGCGFGVRHHGQATIEFNDENRKTLGLKNCGDVQQRAAIASAASINVKGCPFWTMVVEKSQNLECLSVIPEINGKLLQSAEGEYVTRGIDVLSHGIRANNIYDFEGYAFPDVSAQRATTLVGEATQVEVSIDNFELTAEQVQRLRVFQPEKCELPVGHGTPAYISTLEEERRKENCLKKMAQIATELSRVTRVWGRESLHMAYDLSFHSVLGFKCFGEVQPRGWVEVFVVGDSGQAKSTAVERLSTYYNAGQRVNAEQTSGAGLIGGLTKMGDRWVINWGPLVLNDRRLLVLDEFSGINEQVAQQMTDIRSSGIAEIIKIHREKAWARTRIIFLSNPKFGRTMGSFEHGVEALMGLFKEAADVRRLDLAIAVATGDVSVDRINSRGLDGDCSYTSEDCSALVLWAWSRKADQIQFEEGFEEATYEMVKWMSAKYSPKIPLVEPADHRWTLARLSCAMAARLFSTLDGVNLLVRPEHVRAVAAYMDQVYSSPAMSYDAYSNRIMSADRHVDLNRTAIKSRLKVTTHKPADLIDLLLSEHYLSPRDMEVQLGVDKAVVKDIIQFLTQARCLERGKNGYRKKPAFITILKELEAEAGSSRVQMDDLFEGPDLKVVSAMAQDQGKVDDDDMPF